MKNTRPVSDHVLKPPSLQDIYGADVRQNVQAVKREERGAFKKRIIPEKP